jgi:hypothetical protein
MDEHKVVVSDAAIEAALKRAKSQDKGPRAQTMEYVALHRLIVVGLDSGRRLALPVEDMQGLEKATPEQLTKFEILGQGTGISFPELDADFYVPALAEGVYGNRRWMAQLGKRGGAVKTEAKRIAAQRNGEKGGRPKKSGAEGRQPNNPRLGSKSKAKSLRLSEGGSFSSKSSKLSSR